MFSPMQLPISKAACNMVTMLQLIMAQWRYVDWANIGSDNGLLLDRTKPLLESMLASHYWGSVEFTFKQFHSEPKLLFCIMVWKLYF